MDRLNAMHAFVRLVEVGTFSAVADELRVKQSTVSKWVAALEDELGVRLLERTTRSRRVTEPGTRFYQRARQILAAYDDITAQLQRDLPELQGRIRVSVPVVFGRLFIVPAVAKFLRRYPSMEIELMFSDRYINLVEDGFDVAIRVGRPIDSSLRSRRLGRTPRRLVASPGYVARAEPIRVPADLRDHPCLLHTGLSTGDVWAFEHGGKTLRAPIRGRFSANNSEALLAMARGGLGIALLASWLVDAEVRAQRLVTLLPEYEAPVAVIHALMPPGPHVHPRVRRFVDALAEAFDTRLEASPAGRA
ncbi:MAG: LysR family transcriptional regulator [Deltaproteobacteria bacterium]|nr:LysR family transcriptional regulator [Deltaproteobacteria bacterium]